ncbi:MAG: hypothetical protein AAB582_00350 [Patescibacteria group bacterium]
MKLNQLSASALIGVLIILPFAAHADIIPGDPVLSTFENQQGLMVSLEVGGEVITDAASSSLPVGTPLEIEYQIKLGSRNYPNDSEEVRTEILLSILEDTRTYLELWRGTPFTADATFIDSRELSATPEGTVSMSVPEAGEYFFLLYAGDQIRDMDAYCEKYQVEPENCADPEFIQQHTPEEVHPYFTYELDSDPWNEFQFPPIWGGVRFAIDAPSVGAPNILFIPGFTASRLYMTDTDGDEEPLWEPLGSEDIKRLAFTPEGTSKEVVYTRDIVDSIKNLPFGFTVHEEFMEYLDDLKEDEKIADWKGYPYDWRYDVFDVVDNGALKENGSREYLIDVVEELAASSKNGKVAIVAHSNGGLVAKALMVRLEAQGKADLVDKIVLIASPQAGTPKGMFSLLHGREKLLNFIVPAGVLRSVLATLPGAYSLAPSGMYFEQESEKLAEFKSGSKTDALVAAFGSAIDSAVEARGFALNTPETRSTPTERDSGTPLPLSPELIAKTEATHAILDAWVPPAGVTVHEIAGWGQPTVSTGSYYTLNKTCLLGIFFCSQPTIEYKPLTSSDGDETVMSSSALMGEGGVYFNLHELRDQFRENKKHHNLTDSKFLHPYISNLLVGTTPFETDLFPYEKPDTNLANTVVGIHSPALISAEDTEGNVTGIFPLTNSDLMYVREEIPGSSVELGGEGKYLVLPKEGAYDLTIDGTGAGTFGVSFSDEDGNVFKELKDLPISTSTEATLTIDDGSAGSLILDLDGDGKTDGVVKDKLARKDAIAICKKEIGLVRTVFVKLYIALVIGSIESQGKDNAKFQKFVTELKKYVQAHLSSIPPERAAAIATCIHALENSKK